MLSETTLRNLFAEFLDEDVEVLIDTRDDFIAQAKNHPFIQMQMAVGIYDEDNIAEDFLGPARAHAPERVQVLCLDVFNQVLDGIPESIAEDYVRYVAAHEAHHFHVNEPPQSASGHATGEAACIAQTEAKFPHLVYAAKYVESHSPVHQRVQARITARQALARRR